MHLAVILCLTQNLIQQGAFKYYIAVILNGLDTTTHFFSVERLVVFGGLFLLLVGEMTN